jgi:hypothetical protein
MNNMTWLELYNFLHQQANDSKNFGHFEWNEPVIIHDAETGDEYGCDTYYVSNNSGIDKMVLATNIDKIYN